MAKDCKAGKERNSNGRCVKIKTDSCKAGKEKVNGRCVNKCKGKKIRNSKGKCVTQKHRSPSASSTASYHTAKANSFKMNHHRMNHHRLRGLLLTQKRHLKHYSKSKSPKHKSKSAANILDVWAHGY
jgi:hypothetical protein